MDGEEIGYLLASSSRTVLEYVTDLQYAVDPPIGVSIQEVRSFDIHGNYVVLHLDAPLNDQNTPILMINDQTYPDSVVCFERYDDLTRTVLIHPNQDLLSFLSSSGSIRIRVLSDMKFLISSIYEFYKNYGHLIRLPDYHPVFGQARYPSGKKPSEEQQIAIDKILCSPISYIWGAPGTGKTQFVLATAIRTMLMEGKKVAVFAPTNNSVEQVLRGLYESIGEEDAVILRLGIPSKQFLSDFPEMCEDRYAQNRLKTIDRELSNIEEVLNERSSTVLLEDLDELEKSLGTIDLNEPSALLDQLRPYIQLLKPDEIRDVMSTTGSYSICSKLKEYMENKNSPARMISEYSEMSDSDLINEMIELKKEESLLKCRNSSELFDKATILAGTPLQFISRFRPKGTKEDGKIELSVDHIFLDESGYSNLPQALSLFTNGVPVTMLGDHMQLPPVCELNDQILRLGAEKCNNLRDAYLWTLSALYSTMLFTESRITMRRKYIDCEKPDLNLVCCANLTQTRRFGNNLAKILDRYVYQNGLSGSSDKPLAIKVVNCICNDRKERENIAEASAIKTYLQKNKHESGNIAILTPYSGQMQLLKRTLPKRYRDCIMTVHSSQGREWQTVIISVADGRVESRDVPLRFTSSTTEIGKKLINTAVSRAKNELILFCDCEFWIQKKNELISGLIEGATPIEMADSIKDDGSNLIP